MKFGTIGAGAVALGFAREALRVGHQVVLSNFGWSIIQSRVRIWVKTT
jgi:3-hydroxyisobutyrate dehydrogenase-like beta-hydroxyacid dehydrogenase